MGRGFGGRHTPVRKRKLETPLADVGVTHFSTAKRGPARSDALASTAKRRASAFAAAGVERDRYLRHITVSSVTANVYLLAVLFFEGWARRGRALLASNALVDRAMVEYFTVLFFDGESPAEGRNCLYGWIFHRTSEDGNKKGVFPAATRSLRGWTRRSRGSVVDPVPFGVVAMLAIFFAENNLIRLAVFVLLGFDTYLRPSELLSLGASSVHAPARRAGPMFARSWSIVVAPATGDAETKTRLKDVTIIIGDVRPHLLPVFEKFFRNNSRPKFFNYELTYVERKFSDAMKSLHLPLRFTPHVLRHSGPSCDKFEGLRSLEDIRRRGQWASPASVQRYERHAALLRSLHKLSDSQQSAMRSAELAVVDRIVPLLTKSKLA